MELHDLFSLSEDATLLWVGYHPVWLVWGDDRLRIDLQRYYLSGEVNALEQFRINGHLTRLDDARGTEDVMEVMALAHLDDDPSVAEAVEEGVDRAFGRRMIYRFQRQDTAGRRWARWMIRRRRMSPADHADRLDAACQQLIGFGAAPAAADEPPAVTRARIEAIFRAALYRPETAPIATEVLGAYAAGGDAPPRRLALVRLARLPNKICRERVLALMRHENPVVRENAAFAIPRKRPVSDRAELNDELFVLLEDPEVAVATEALNTLVDIVAGGTRMVRFKNFAAEVASDPSHRLHTALREAIEWNTGKNRSRPGFKKRMGMGA